MSSSMVGCEVEAMIIMMETRGVLEPYPRKFLDNAMTLMGGEACGQLLSDRLIWYDLDVLDLRDRITQLLLDADGAVFLSVTVPPMLSDLKFRFYTSQNIGNVVSYFKEVWTITKSILQGLNQDTLPLLEMAVLVFRLNALHDALCRVNLD